MRVRTGCTAGWVLHCFSRHKLCHNPRNPVQAAPAAQECTDAWLTAGALLGYLPNGKSLPPKSALTETPPSLRVPAGLHTDCECAKFTGKNADSRPTREEMQEMLLCRLL